MTVKRIEWDEKKNRWLKDVRNITFEEVAWLINTKNVLAITPHPNSKRYPNQKIFIISINKYVYMVPFVEDEEKYFLKTVIPSRKMRRLYGKGGEKA